MTDYLVQYGRSAFVGRFVCAEELALERGTSVVVQTPRGIEVGMVLAKAERFASRVDPTAGGELLRLRTSADELDQRRMQQLERDLLAAVDHTPEPISFIDVEVMLDGSMAILHGLPWGPCQIDPLLAELSDRFGTAVRLLDVSRTPTAVDVVEKVEAAGCGKPGCGTEEGGGGCGTGEGGCSTGGCSTGGCSRGEVQNADDLSRYFADLRNKMEAAGMTRTSLN